MSMVVWKYPLVPKGRSGECVIVFPVNGKITHVGLDPADDKTICLWIHHSDQGTPMPCRFYIRATGEECPRESAVMGGRWVPCIGSVRQGPFMWHIFSELTFAVDSEEHQALFQPESAEDDA